MLLSVMYPFERFTDAAKEMLTLAQQEAERSQHSYIGTEHLLLAMTRQSGAIASVVLMRLGVAHDDVRERIVAVLGREERIVIQQIIPTSRVKRVIEMAFAGAQQQDSRVVATDHVLIALALEGEGIAAHVLV
ncbi:MAG: NDP-hexose 4-ketoreductase, partial [Candidatus Dormibacteraeota bacterium]|nr:NDP-hexose 4-ketoreductase [Candidatus Dormibacteraeota bacterium]